MTKLSASHGRPVENPSATQVTQALMDIEDDNGSFVILDADHGFIQTTIGSDNGLLVQYRMLDTSIINSTVRMDLTVEEVAVAMDISRATAHRDLTFARAWLSDRLESGPES